jgi:hypothetical protein
VQNEHLFFDFERDFPRSLRCIPLTIRFNMDRCVIKLSLRQWVRFSPGDRQALLVLPCETSDEIHYYKQHMIAMIADRAKEQAKETVMEAAPAWTNTSEVPEQISRFARSLELDPPTLQQWSELALMQRYALVKLSRGGHDNVNFIPAMREFGLLAAGGDPVYHAVPAVNEEAR